MVVNNSSCCGVCYRLFFIISCALCPCFEMSLMLCCAVVRVHQLVAHCSSCSHVHSHGKGNRTTNLHNISLHSDRPCTLCGHILNEDTIRIWENFPFQISDVFTCGSGGKAEAKISIFNDSRDWNWLFSAWNTLPSHSVLFIFLLIRASMLD